MRCFGLSPRVRGNRLPTGGATGQGRSIPACTGEPVPQAGASSGFGVYPRVWGNRAFNHAAPHVGGSIPACAGEPPWTHRLGHSLWGLSPRVRGNLCALAQRQADRRSIPACAGEPGQASVPARLVKVYPRVCGGTKDDLVANTGYDGLSPRVRGNLPASAIVLPSYRSIPACAGEPRPQPQCRFELRVYPRVCGGTRS